MASILDKLKSSKIIKEAIFDESQPVEFISTGCLPLNILYSGKLDGGIPIGKVSTIAAPSGLGKSFIGLKLAKNAQKHHNMEVLYLDTEYAYDPKFAKNIGVDTDRMIVLQSNRIEEVQQMIASSILDLPKEDRKKLILIIDSWGGLVTSKAINDAVVGKDVSDLTPAKKKNALARLLTGLNTTTFIVNHVYENLSMYDPLTIGGGKGLIFASSAIVMGTSKAKSKEGEEINGSIITARNYKGRFSIENAKLKYMIRYEGGIHPHYGILDEALESGHVTKPSMGWYTRPGVENDKKWREKEIWENSKEFWNPIVYDPDFKFFIEKKFSFEHNNIFSDHQELSSFPNEIEEENIDLETGEILEQEEPITSEEGV